MTRLLLDFTNQVSSIKWKILIDAGLNENQIRMSFELKLQLTGTKKRCFYGM
jgi:hypothetical protein